MNRITILRAGRKRRVVLGLSAAAISGLAIVGAAAAANAAPDSPAPNTDTVQLVEVPGAVPDLDSVEAGEATEVEGAVIEWIDEGQTTEKR